MYDLKQKTFHALHHLAEEYEIFEKTMKKVTNETEGDMLFWVAYEAMEELDMAQKDQERLQDEMEGTRESMVIASREFTNCWALHEVASASLNGAFREVSNCRALHDVTCVDLKMRAKGPQNPNARPTTPTKEPGLTENAVDVLRKNTRSPKQPSTTVCGA